LFNKTDGLPRSFATVDRPGVCLHADSGAAVSKLADSGAAVSKLQLSCLWWKAGAVWCASYGAV